MVFRRREPRAWWRAALELLWPRGGWRRAGEYVRHRLRRLPDSPEKIGRGMAAGVFTAFTPFFGLHFLIGLLLARVVRGNYVAALIGTFAVNPLTIVPITVSAMWTGQRLMGVPPEEKTLHGIGHAFGRAWDDVWRNLGAAFTPAHADWGGLGTFMHEVFLPYLIGGVVPGLLAGLAAFWLTVPAARAWQAARRRQLAERLERLRPPPGDGRRGGARG